MGDEFLGGGGVEEFEVFFGDGFDAIGGGVFVDDGDGGLGEDGNGRGDDFKVVSAEFLERQESLVFPGEEDIALATLGEGERRATCAGIEDRDVFVEFGDEGFGLGFVIVILLEGPAPCGEVVPTCAAGGFGVGGDDFDVRLDEVGPIVDVFGIALADEEDDGAGVGGAVGREPGLPIVGKKVGLSGRWRRYPRRGRG